MFQSFDVSPAEKLFFQKVNYGKEEMLFHKIKSKGFQLDALESIQNTKRRIEWLSVREIISESMPQGEDIIYDEHNKPHFKNSKFHLSISHSNEMIAVGINQIQKIGIDLQYITDKIIRIKKKFLDERELHMCSDDPQELTGYWSVKEALFKIYGKKDAYLKENMKVTSYQFNDLQGKAKGQLKVGAITESYNFELRKLNNYMLAYSVNS